MENFDLSPWVRAPEVRKHLEKTWSPTALEQEQLIIQAHCPLEERVQALLSLQRWAEDAGERRVLRQMYRYFRFALTQIREDAPGTLYLWEQRKAGVGASAGGFLYDGAELATSYEQLLAKCREYDDAASGWRVVRYIAGENGPKKLVTFCLEIVDGQLCETRFHVNGDVVSADLSEQEQADFDEADERYHGLIRSSYSLPFATGDLVRVDAPCFSEPVTGVLYCEPDGNGTVYSWLGYIKNGRFDTLDFVYDRINTVSQYRVIDWLHSADAAMFPAGHEILVEFGAYMKGLSQREAENVFFRVFRRDSGGPRQAYQKIPVKLEELLSQFSNQI